MNITYQQLKTAAVIYAAVPIAVFFLGWLNIVSAVLFTLLLCGAMLVLIRKSKKDDHEYRSIQLSKKQFILLGLIAAVWCFLAGQGGFIHQSSDNVIRNAVFYDMITKPWPVTYDEGQNMLCYYIAHWMIPSAVGKLVYAIAGVEFIGYLAGNAALLIWSSGGVFLTLLLITMVTNTGKKLHPIFSAVLFIFFSGLDVFGGFIGGSIFSTHLEWWAEYFQFSSNTTCLFWVYNQTIVIWLVTLCIINEKKLCNFAALGMLAFPYGPFPFVGIVILCVVKAVFIAHGQVKEKNIKGIFTDAFSPQNILSVLAIAPVYILYYTANAVISNNVVIPSGAENTAAQIESGFRFHSVLSEHIRNGNTEGIFSFIGAYLLFILLEVGIYLALVIYANRKKQDCIVIASTASLLVIPLFQVGVAYDFAMRVSIPALIYLCAAVIRVIIRELPERSEVKSLDSLIKSKGLLCVMMLIFVLGAINPFTEYKREISETYYLGNGYRIIDTLEDYDVKFNFVAGGYQNSPFYKYLCRK